MNSYQKKSEKNVPGFLLKGLRKFYNTLKISQESTSSVSSPDPSEPSSESDTSIAKHQSSKIEELIQGYRKRKRRLRVKRRTCPNSPTRNFPSHKARFRNSFTKVNFKEIYKILGVGLITYLTLIEPRCGK